MVLCPGYPGTPSVRDSVKRASKVLAVTLCSGNIRHDNLKCDIIRENVRRESVAYRRVDANITNALHF